jgi:hypothetical protein
MRTSLVLRPVADSHYVDAAKLLLAAGGRVEVPEPQPDAKSGQEHTSHDRYSHAIDRN